MRPPTVQSLSVWSLLATGDFALSARKLQGTPSFAVARTPQRSLFFTMDPSAFYNAATLFARDFRDREDDERGSGGVVGATGDDWLRRREQLRVMQKKEALEMIAAPAVAKSFLSLKSSSEVPPLQLPPPALLAWSGSMVRHTLHTVALSAQPPVSVLPPQLGADRRRPAGPIPRLIHAWLSRALRSLASLLVLMDQTRALLGGRTSFFDLAQAFTSRSRKVDRKVMLLRSRAEELKSRLRRRDGDGSSVGGRGAERYAAWVASVVHQRATEAEASRSSSDGVAAAAASAPQDMLEVLLDAADLTNHSAEGGRDSAPESASCPFSGAAKGDPTDLGTDARASGAAISTATQQRLSLDEVVDVTRDILTAGVETTATTLSTAALLLRRYPHVASKVAKEALALDALYGALEGMSSEEQGAEEERSAEDTSEGSELLEKLTAAMVLAASQPAALAYTRAVVLETARLYPAAPLLLRVALRDTTLDGVTIPQGSGLIASTAQLNQHPSAWQAAEDFLPERFIPGSPFYRDADAAKAYLSFGTGPRSCVGQQLAITVASLALAYVAADAAMQGALEHVD